MKLKNLFRKEELLKFLIEALVVLLGVLMAFYLTQRSTQKKTDRNTELTLIYLLEEIEYNAGLYETAIEYHEALTLNIDSAIANIDTAAYHIPYYKYQGLKYWEIPGWRGVGTVNFRNNIFEGAKVSGVFQELNIETLQSITRAYAFLEFYDEFALLFLTKLISLDSEKKVIDAIHILDMMNNDLFALENQIHEQLQVVIEELGHSIEEKNFSKN